MPCTDTKTFLWMDQFLIYSSWTLAYKSLSLQYLKNDSQESFQLFNKLTESSAAKTKLYIFKLFVKYMFGNN